MDTSQYREYFRFQRLKTADEEIIEVLLEKGQIVSALRFVRSAGKVDTVSARKFLEAAKSLGDADVFFSVFRFFEQRNMRLRGNTKFAQGEPAVHVVRYFSGRILYDIVITGEHCESYVQHFKSLFGETPS